MSTSVPRHKEPGSVEQLQFSQYAVERWILEFHRLRGHHCPKNEPERPGVKGRCKGDLLAMGAGTQPSSDWNK